MIGHGGGSIGEWVTSLAAGGTLTGKLTAGASEIEGSNFDINGGDISAVTISGDLTWSSAQTGVTLTSPAINGTVTTTGLTLPAFTGGGNITMGGNDITGAGVIYGNSTYVRIGDAGTTGHSLSTDDDLMVTGKLEVDGAAYFDSTIDTAGKLTAGANEIEGSNFDIDGGDISAGTISGGLTWSSAQDLNSQALTNVNIDSGTVDAITSLSTASGAKITAGGETAVDYRQNWFGGSFTSGGTGTSGIKQYFSGTLTGANDDTSRLVGTQFTNAIATQNDSDTIGVVSQVMINEPNISKGGTDTVTVASTLYIADSPSEGATNAAIYVASGDTNLSTVTLRGKLTAGANEIEGSNFDIDGGDISAGTISGDLTWSTAQTGVTLTSPAINGTVTTTGLTMPAFTGGGDITFGDTTVLRTGVSADDYFSIQSYDMDGTAYVTLLQFINDNDPFFTIGAESGYAVKFDPAMNGIYFGDLSNSWDLLLNFGSSALEVRNSADAAYVDIRCKDIWLANVYPSGKVDYYATATGYFNVSNGDAGTVIFQGRDIGVGHVEIGRMMPAADPYFRFGRNDTGVSTSAITDGLVLQMGAGSNNEAQGQGFGIAFNIGNAASEVEKRGAINCYLQTATDGSEDSQLHFWTMAGGALNQAFKVDEAGELYADLDGSGGSYLSNGVNLFDKFDDVQELRRFQLTVPDSGLISEEQRLANRERMRELGVVEAKIDGDGDHLKIQTMFRLVAGGIYQNRVMLDNIVDRLEALEAGGVK